MTFATALILAAGLADDLALVLQGKTVKIVARTLEGADESGRVEHEDGDYTLVLRAISPGVLTDPVERDYSWLDDADGGDEA